MRFRVTSPYGALEEFREEPHMGTDIAMEKGTELHALQDGVVTQIANYGDSNAGKTLFVEMEDGNTAIYGHLSELNVTEGQTINAGDLLAHSGNTGNSTGAHLHLSIKNPEGEYVDPAPYVDQIQSPSWWDRFVENGQVENQEYADSSLLDLLGGFAVNISQLDEYLVAAGIVLALLWFKPTRYVIFLSAFVWLFV
jgi:hypothetical protein